MALKAVDELKKSIQCIKEEYPELLSKVDNAFYEERKAQFFIELIIFERNAKEILENINKNGIRKSVTSHETEYEKLCNAFFEVLFTYKCEEVINLLEVFTDENIECLCDFLIQAQNLRYLKDRKISGKLRNCLVNCTEKTTGILMLK